MKQKKNKLNCGRILCQKKEKGTTTCLGQDMCKSQQINTETTLTVIYTVSVASAVTQIHQGPDPFISQSGVGVEKSERVSEK